MAECQLRKAAQIKPQQKAAGAVHNFQRKYVMCRADPKEQSASAGKKCPKEIQMNKGGLL